MPRTRPGTPPPSQPDPLEAAVRKQDYSTALQVIRTRHAAAPTPETFRQYRQALVAAAQHFAEHGKAEDLRRVVTEGEGLAPEDPAWLAELGGILARGGELTAALAYAERVRPAGYAARVLAHVADAAIQTGARDRLPPPLQPGFDAIQQAFRHYEAGDDEAARTALQPIGLQSEFLEWKMFLRGLMAQATGDTPRALENWQRLSADRLPARLAAPLRAALDPAFRKVQPPTLERQLDRLLGDGLLDGLRHLRGELARDKPLTAAFRRIEQLLPVLRRQAPDLVSRLATVCYRAILTHGQPTDLPKYRKLFGAPPDDPAFHRLEALVLDDGRQYEEANRHWAAYEAWLAKPQPGWSPEVARRARAIILNRMAQNTAQMADDPNQDLRELMAGFFGQARPRGRRAAPPDPTPLWRRAIELAPDWEEPARALFHRLVAQGKAAEAEQVARQLLEHNPTALPVLGALASRCASTGRAAEALELRTKALAANPLDKSLRVQAVYAYIGAARRQAIDGQLAEAEKTLEAGATLCAEELPAAYFAFRSTLARKVGRGDEADEYRTRALAVPGGRLFTLFFLAVDAALLKLKPAAKRPADQALTAALAGPAAPREANLLYAAWDMYHLEGITYRGQKTQEKKIHDLILRTPESEGPAFDFELLAQNVALRNEWKVAEKLAQKLQEKFPENPVFPLLLAEAEFAKSDGMPRPYRVVRPLNKARRLAERSPEPRHRELLDRIRRLQDETVDPDFFPDFFAD